MIFLAYFIFGFALMQLIVALVNLLFSQQFTKSDFNENGLVSVLIPARNEEGNIANLLADLLSQPYKNIEVIVFDDLSTDNTVMIVQHYAKLDPRVKLISSKGLPEGWLGKNYACHSLSNYANGSYFLFLDADVRVNGSIINDSMAYSKKHKLGLLTIFPKQIIKSWGEYITVPNMNFILLSLLPLVLVRTTKNNSLAAANGQFMLFEACAYKINLPHELMKANKVEDIEIARYYKQRNIPIACLTGNNNVECRMYNGFTDAVNGFSKNVISFFGNSFVLALLFWLITTFGWIIIFNNLSFNQSLVYLLILLLTRIIISYISLQNIFLNIFMLIPQQLVLGMFIYKAFVNSITKNYKWKDRNIS
jgi:glycosyltransferase involved in cell wall biosynthesis